MSTTDRFFENIKTKAKVLGLGMFMFFSGQSAAAQTASSKDKAPTTKHTLASQKTNLSIHGVRLSLNKVQPADITHAYNTSKALQNNERAKQWNRVSSRFAALEKAGFWHISQSDYASQDELFAYKTFVTTTAGYPLGKVIKMLEQAKKETGSNDVSKISAKVYDLLIAQSSKYKHRFIEEKNSVQTMVNYINQNGGTKVLTPIENNKQETKKTKANNSNSLDFAHISATRTQPPASTLLTRIATEQSQLFQNDKMNDRIATDSAQILQDVTMSFTPDTGPEKLKITEREVSPTDTEIKKSDNIRHYTISGLTLDADLQEQFDADMSKIKSGGTYHGNIKVDFADMKTSSSFAWVWEAWNKPAAYNDGSHGGGKSLGLFQFNLANTMRTFMKKYGKNHPKLNEIYQNEGFSRNFRHEWDGMHGTYEKDPVKKAQMFVQVVNEQDEHMWSQYDGPFAYFAKKYQKDNFPLITEKKHNDLETMTLVAAVKMAINQGPNRIYKIVSLGVTEAKMKYGNNPTSHQLAHEISLARIKVWPKYANRYRDETKMLDDFETWRIESQKIEANYQKQQQERNLLAQNSSSRTKLIAEASSTRVSQIQSDTIYLRKFPQKTVTMKQLLAQRELKRRILAGKV